LESGWCPCVEVAIVARVHNVGSVEFAKLTFDVPLELLTVFALEGAELIDPVLQKCTLLLE
jgi:hypothetical protein